MFSKFSPKKPDPEQKPAHEVDYYINNEQLPASVDPNDIKVKLIGVNIQILQNKAGELYAHYFNLGVRHVFLFNHSGANRVAPLSVNLLERLLFHYYKKAEIAPTDMSKYDFAVNEVVKFLADNASGPNTLLAFDTF